jgi:hypothetical protein
LAYGTELITDVKSDMKQAVAKIWRKIFGAKNPDLNMMVLINPLRVKLN